jgi:hypothetical protein
MAWGNTGHEAVACAAWKRLDQPTKDKIYALLQTIKPIKGSVTIKSGPNAGTTMTITVAGFKAWSANMPADVTTDDERHMYIFMRAATWPDSIKNALFHGTDTPPANEPIPDVSTGFVDRHAYKYWHFIDTALGDPQQGKTKAPAWKCSGAEPAPVKTLPDAPQPNAVVQINALAGALPSDKPSLQAYDLVWLEHLVGDVHQPLHATVRYVDGVPDQGGNCVAISMTPDIRSNFVRASTKNKYPTELHAFWDDLPGIGGQMDTKMAADYASHLPAVDEDAAANLNTSDWAQESFKIAASDAYASPIGPAFGATKAYAISATYYTTAADDAQARIALAGARLANLLKKALN